MPDRLLHPADYPLPHPPLIAFIRANGLDEFEVSAAHPLIIQGEELTVSAFIREPDATGRLRPVLADDGESYQKHSVTVPLKSPPEDHGL